MGRPEQRRRENKKAAESCRKLDEFIVKKAKTSSRPTDDIHDNDKYGGSAPTTGSQNEEGKNDRTRPAPSNSKDESLVVEDIGRIIKETTSTEEIKCAIQNLSDGSKYRLLKQHFRPNNQTIFYSGGCNRSFQLEWLATYPWMVYSPHLDAAFCIYCALFAKNREQLGAFVNRPFTRWYKTKEKATNHMKTAYHQEAVKDGEQFIRSVETPQSNVDVQLESRLSRNIKKNRELLGAIVDAVLFCARQGMGLRGDNESLFTSGNPGNFLATLRLISQYSTALRDHLEAPALRNAKYTSSIVQNEIIEIIGVDIIQRRIVNAVQRAGFYTILGDEVTSHNIEQLALCLRFVDHDNLEIREEFIQFSKLQRTTGAHVALDIMETLKKLNIPIELCRGQGYDGAANMSSSAVGVQARIKQGSPLAKLHTFTVLVIA